MLNGNVKPNAIGIYSPGSDFGAASRIAAGTAIYDALAVKIAKIKRLPSSVVTNLLNNAIRLPLSSGIKSANAVTNHPYFLNAANRFAVTIPISSRNIAKKP